jgi:hypothetical protein
MAHARARHPSGDLRSCKSVVLPICHLLFLDGVYVDSGKFRWVKAPTNAELTQLIHTIAQRIGR